MLNRSCMHIISMLKSKYSYSFIISFVIVLQLECRCKPPATLSYSAEKAQETSPGLVTRKIYMFNGLWQSADTFKNTIEQLSTELRSQGLIVDIQAFQESLTSKRTLDEQGHDAF